MEIYNEEDYLPQNIDWNYCGKNKIETSKLHSHCTWKSTIDTRMIGK